MDYAFLLLLVLVQWQQDQLAGPDQQAMAKSSVVHGLCHAAHLVHWTYLSGEQGQQAHARCSPIGWDECLSKQVLSVQWVSAAVTMDATARLICSVAERRRDDCCCTCCVALTVAPDLRADSICRSWDLAQIHEIEEAGTFPLRRRRLEEARYALREDQLACLQLAHRDALDRLGALVEVLAHRNAREASRCDRGKLEVGGHPCDGRHHAGRLLVYHHVHAATVFVDHDGCRDRSEWTRCLQVHPG